jgi:hypothetical protein
MESSPIAPWLAEAVAAFQSVYGPRRRIRIIIRDADDAGHRLVYSVPPVRPAKPLPFRPDDLEPAPAKRKKDNP